MRALHVQRIESIARPAVVFRAFNYAGTDRIEFDIPITSEAIEITINW